MAFGLSLGLSLSGSSYRARIPTFIGRAQNTGGNPTIPTHQAGDLLVGMATVANSTPIAVPTGWDDWDSQGANSISVRLCSVVAAGPGTTVDFVGAGSVRQVWVWRNAQRGTTAKLNVATGSTVCAWPDMTLSAPSRVVLAGYKAGAQTDASVIMPAGYSWSINTPKNTSVAHCSAQSVDLLTVFTPPDGAWDSPTGAHQLMCYSVMAS
jgi:hypothetical protein